MLVNQFVDDLFTTLPVAPKTLGNYRGEYRRHLAASLGPLQIQQVTSADIRQSVRGLPPQTMRLTLMVARTIFREAQRCGLIDNNPARGVETPNVRVAPSTFLTWEQVSRSDFGVYNDQIRFLALHGLRWGEAVALDGSEINDGYVSVTKSIHGATKSAAGVRRIPFMGFFAPFPKTARPLRRVLSPYGVTIHSLRKTYAYLLKSNGVHVTTAQKLMGHADPTVTLRIYTLVRDEEIEATGALLRRAITSYVRQPDLSTN